MSDAAASPAPAPAASETVLTAGAPAPAAAPATDAAAPAPAAAPAASTVLTDDLPTEGDGQAKPKEEGTDDADKSKGDDKAKTEEEKGAPEQYADFKLPETVLLDAPVMDEFKSLAKDLGLTQSAAQKLVDLQVKAQAGNAQAFTANLQAHVDRVKGEWEAAAQADPEIGGAEFKANVVVAKQALDTFGSPALKAFLAESRLGSHPEMIRFMVKAGKAISQDGFVPGRASSAERSTADVLYGPSSK